MDAVKLVCVLAIPCAVVGGVCGPISGWGGGDADDLCFLLAPVPSMVVVFVQRVKANGRRGACAGLGWDALFYQMICLQATGEGAQVLG